MDVSLGWGPERDFSTCLKLVTSIQGEIERLQTVALVQGIREDFRRKYAPVVFNSNLGVAEGLKRRE